MSEERFSFQIYGIIWDDATGRKVATVFKAEDARLKAAPALLEACRAVVEAYYKQLGSYDHLEDTDVAYRQARAAIADATEETR